MHKVEEREAGLKRAEEEVGVREAAVAKQEQLLLDERKEIEELLEELKRNRAILDDQEVCVVA